MGATVGVPRGSTPGTCPVHAWRTWAEAAGIEGGPAFRAVGKGGAVSRERMAGRAVARIVQRRWTVADIAAEFHVSRPTIYRYIEIAQQSAT